jgi:putative endonuclease
MKMNENNAGLEAEKLAATFLMNHGLKLVAQNYHCRFGEIDLIMKDAKTLVFVEVRLRSNSQYGNAVSSITPQKQNKLILTAQHYLQLHGESACRFDAILMSRANLQNIEWIRNAFDA